MATTVFDGIKFCEQFLKMTSQGTFLPSLVQIGPAVWGEKMFKKNVDSTRQTQDHLKPPLEHVVLRLAKKVVNTVGKREIARYEQFLLFPHVFQKTCTADN